MDNKASRFVDRVERSFHKGIMATYRGWRQIFKTPRTRAMDGIDTAWNALPSARAAWRTVWDDAAKPTSTFVSRTSGVLGVGLRWVTNGLAWGGLLTAGAFTWLTYGVVMVPSALATGGVVVANWVVGTGAYLGTALPGPLVKFAGRRVKWMGVKVKAGVNFAVHGRKVKDVAPEPTVATPAIATPAVAETAAPSTTVVNVPGKVVTPRTRKAPAAKTPAVTAPAATETAVEGPSL